VSVPGHLIADRYRLVRPVGSGGMGVVWEGWDERLQRRVAVKQLRLPAELTDHERGLASQRAMREARITARLHHRFAVSVFDVVVDDGRPSLIMQFVPSRTLSEVLAEGAPLPHHEVARLGTQIASALSAAHELQIMHRDVKPANVLVADDGTAHISDFGISRALDDMGITTSGMVHGTPAYLSPEVARGEQATFASDVFGLGATLYAALEGSPPFGTDSNSIALLHRVASGEFEPPRSSGQLTPLVLDLLSSDPAARPLMRTAASMLAELASNLADAQPSGFGENSETNELTAPAATSTSTAAVEKPSDPTAGTVDAAPRTQAVPVPPVEMEREAGPADSDDAPLRWTWRRRRAALVAVVIAALAVVGIGTAVLLRLLGGPVPATVAQPPSSSTSTASGPTTRSRPTNTAAPTSAPRSPDRTSSPSPRRSPTPTPSPEGNSPTAAELRNAITTYYALMPTDTDGAWPLMTDEYKGNHMHGRQGFERFWGAIDNVKVSDVSATPPDRSEATLTYRFKNGRVVVERTSYKLVDEGGTMKIAESSVLSSSTR
jgi:eukaryotic-like serine/threonine-protein kinase